MIFFNRSKEAMEIEQMKYAAEQQARAMKAAKLLLERSAKKLQELTLDDHVMEVFRDRK